MKFQEKMSGLRGWLSWEKLKAQARSWGRMLLNPRLLLCLFIAWMITNGWSYILFGLGMLLKINWMSIVGGAYMSFLWLPFTPEKLLTLALAIVLLRLLYPRDQKTLGMLRAKLRRFRRRREPE